MKSKGANTVIAVDVGSEYPAELTNYSDHLSGWWLLWKKWNPFGEKIYVSDDYRLLIFAKLQLGLCQKVKTENCQTSSSKFRKHDGLSRPLAYHFESLCLRDMFYVKSGF